MTGALLWLLMTSLSNGKHSAQLLHVATYRECVFVHHSHGLPLLMYHHSPVQVFGNPPLAWRDGVKYLIKLILPHQGRFATCGVCSRTQIAPADLVAPFGVSSSGVKSVTWLESRFFVTQFDSNLFEKQYCDASTRVMCLTEWFDLTRVMINDSRLDSQSFLQNQQTSYLQTQLICTQHNHDICGSVFHD